MLRFFKKRIIIVFLIIAFLLILFSFGPVFDIDKVEIDGNSIIQESWITSVIGGIPTKNLVYYPSRTVEKKLRASIPQIENVKFRRNLLNKTLTIKVVERVPFANIISYPNQYLIDSKGIILNRDLSANILTMGEYSELPMITGISEKGITQNTRLVSPYVEVVQITMKLLLNLFDNAGSKFDLQNLKDIRVLTPDLIEVKIGSVDHLDEKYTVLKRILEKQEQKKQNNIQYIDVKFPKYPVVKYI